MDTKARLAAIRAEEDAENAIADALREEVGEEMWGQLIHFNTYGSMACNLRLRFFWSPTGKPACAFDSVRE